MPPDTHVLSLVQPSSVHAFVPTRADAVPAPRPVTCLPVSGSVGQGYQDSPPEPSAALLPLAPQNLKVQVTGQMALPREAPRASALASAGPSLCPEVVSSLVLFPSPAPTRPGLHTCCFRPGPLAPSSQLPLEPSLPLHTRCPVFLRVDTRSPSLGAFRTFVTMSPPSTCAVPWREAAPRPHRSPIPGPGTSRW